MSAPTSNVQVRPNVVAKDRFGPGGERWPEDFQRLLDWRELRLFVEVFWSLRSHEVLGQLTPEQRIAMEAAIGLPHENGFGLVCRAERHVLSVKSAERDAPALRQVPTPTAPAPSVPGKALVRQEDPQTAFIEDPIHTHHLVLAPPGTGKTEAVLRRLLTLAQRDLGFDLSRVLVASFSTAAAQEVRDRLRGATVGREAVEPPNVRTLDSFAGRILTDLIPGLRGRGYNAAIRTLTQVLEGTHGAELRLRAINRVRSEVSIVVIDEVQDIVGPRARLLPLLLDTLDGVPHEIDVLGDLRQAIYGWQLEQGRDITEEERKCDCYWLVREIQKRRPTMRTVEFTTEWRFSPDLRESLARIRTAMDSTVPDVFHGERPDPVQVQAFIRGLQPIEHPMDLLGAQFHGHRTAILARSNDEVLRVHAACMALEQDHGRRLRVLIRRDDDTLPGWVARVLGGAGAPTVFDHVAFVTRFRERVEDDAEAAERAFHWVAATAGSDPRLIRRADFVAAVLAGGGRSEAALSPPSADITVSTVHQAKGREYDIVVILESGRNLTRCGPEESRIMYVAATRAKKRLYRCHGPDWKAAVLPLDDVSFDIERCADVDRAGGAAAWQDAQAALWTAHEGRGWARILFDARDGRWVLEPAMRVVGIRPPVIFRDEFSGKIEEYARRQLLLSQPRTSPLSCRIIDLRTHVTADPEASFVLLPVIGGNVGRS